MEKGLYCSVTSTLTGDKPKQTPQNGPSGPESLSINFPSQKELVGEFKKIYDQEWRSTFHDIEKHYRVPEEVVTDILAAIAKVVDIFYLYFDFFSVYLYIII